MYQVFASEPEPEPKAEAEADADAGAEEAAVGESVASDAGTAVPSGLVDVAGDVHASNPASAAKVKRDPERAVRIRRLKAPTLPRPGA
jgi:hypothetical protein